MHHIVLEVPNVCSRHLTKSPDERGSDHRLAHEDRAPRERGIAIAIELSTNKARQSGGAVITQNHCILGDREVARLHLARALDLLLPECLAERMAGIVNRRASLAMERLGLQSDTSNFSCSL